MVQDSFRYDLKIGNWQRNETCQVVIVYDTCHSLHSRDMSRQFQQQRNVYGQTLEMRHCTKALEIYIDFLDRHYLVSCVGSFLLHKMKLRKTMSRSKFSRMQKNTQNDKNPQTIVYKGMHLSRIFHVSFFKFHFYKTSSV